MQQCPSCSGQTIPGWRRFFSRRERFKCSACGVWLRYRNEQRSSGLPGIKSVWGRAVASALLAHGLIASLALAAAYARCYLRLIPGWAFMALVFGALGVMSLCTERRILKGLHLAVAERQDSKPHLDLFKDLAVLARTSEGRQLLLSPILFFAVMMGGVAAWRPIAIAMSEILPPLPVCQREGRSPNHQVAQP